MQTAHPKVPYIAPLTLPLHHLTHTPRAQTLVVIRTFSFPSRNLWMMEARWSTVSSPLSKDTWWPSCIISTVNHLAFRRVCMEKMKLTKRSELKASSCVCRWSARRGLGLSLSTSHLCWNLRMWHRALPLLELLSLSFEGAHPFTTPSSRRLHSFPSGMTREVG